MKFNLNINWNIKTNLILCMLLFSFCIAQAQRRTIKGTVTGDGGPLPGVSVLVKGTANGVITDFDGNYEIKAAPTATLLFSYIGFTPQEIAIGNKTNISIELMTDVATLEEVVVVGYGTQKKKEVTGAVVSIKSEALEKTTTSDIGTALQGQIAGVNVTASSGAPGEEANILIRGYGSMLDGQNSPLYVVDGIPFDSDPQLSISEIESIDVLKDAASASIYGTRGSNGVILITTKQGKVGQMNIRVNTEYGVQKINSTANTMTPEEFTYVELLRSSLNSGKTQGGVDGLIHRNSSFLTNNTKLSDIILNDLAPIQNHSVNVSGGKDGLTYSFNANLFDQQGVMISSSYKRLNVRSNTQFTKGKWKITTGLTFKRDAKIIPNSENSIMNKIYDYKPYQRHFDLNAAAISDVSEYDINEWQINEARNLAGVVRSFKIHEDRKGNSHTGNVQFNYDASKALKLTFRTAATYDDRKGIKISPRVDVFNTQGVLIPSNQSTSNRTTDLTTSKITFEGFLNYTKKFGKHNIKFLAGMSKEKSTGQSYSVELRDNLNPAITVFDNYATVYNVGSTGAGASPDYTKVLYGNIARVQYNFASKYLFSASGRYDGSSSFSDGIKWGFFPSISAGWNVSDEDFWEPIKDVVNSFKIRASYGTTGNDRAPYYSNQSVVQAGKNYVFGSAFGDLNNVDASNEGVALGTTQEAYANTDLKWETNIESNIGYDLALFKNKLTISTDIYKSEKKDLLYPVGNPNSSGVYGNNSTTIFNVGNMENSGIEYAIKYRQKNKGGINWNVAATYTQNNNMVTKTSLSNPIIYLNNSFISSKGTREFVSVITEGYEVASFFLRETDGIIKTEEQLAEYQKLEPSAKIGELKYVDQLTVDTNNDGIPDAGDGTINDEDRKYMGSGTPDFEVGLNFSANYKGIDFSMNWYGSFGSEVLNGSKAYAYQGGTHKDIYYSWTQNNQNASIPWYDGNNTRSYRGASDYFLENGDFIRLRNVSLGYTLPKNFIEKIGVTKLRVYVQAQNPITITDYKGFDPEVGNNGLSKRGIDSGTYPVSSQYKVGLQFQF